jgi:hypothetical protein
MLSIRNLWESTARKNNADGSRQNRKAAISEFATRYVGLIESKKVSWSDVSIKALWQGLVESQDLEESINSSAFPLTMQSIVQTRVLEASKAFGQAARSLVTIVPGNQKEVLMNGFGPTSDLYEVREGDEYRELTVGEVQKTVTAKKYGGIMSITEEAIKFDQTGTVLAKAAQIGQRGAAFENRMILKAVVDSDVNVYGGAELYPTNNANGNYISGATTDLSPEGWTSVDNVLGQMVDSDGEPIDVQFAGKPTLMVPTRLKTNAIRLKTAEYGAFGTGNIDPNVAKDQFDVVVNPYITPAASATAWFYGNFKAEFALLEVWPIQTFSRAGQDIEEGFYRDVVQVFKVRMMEGVGAVSTKYVVKSAGA